MSNNCIFQSEQKDIGEARCIIPSILRPKHLEKYCSTGFESWLCEYRGDESHCPIYNMYISHTEDYHEDCCSSCEECNDDESYNMCKEDALQ